MDHLLLWVQLLKKDALFQIQTCINILTYWFQSTCCERIPNVTLIASAGGNVILNPTVCIYSTCSRTWINTVQLLTCFAGWTVWIDNTFWSTCYIRISKVVWNTLAGCCSISFIADSIGSTRRWSARINNLCRNWQCCNSCAVSEWISCISWITGTRWIVILDWTWSVGSTNSRTRINTLLIDTGSIGRTFRVDSTLWFTFYIWISK